MDKKVVAGVGMGAVIALFLGGKAVASHIAAKEVDKAIADVAEYVEVDYQKVDQSLIGRGTTVKGVVITPVGSSDPIKVDKVVLYDFDQKNDIPTRLDFALKGISIDLATLNENGASLAELGYEGDLSGDFATEYEYTADEKIIRLKKIELGAEDVGTFEIDLELANVILDDDAIANFPFSLLGAELQNGKITYSDDSFIERVIETGAAEEGITVDEAKQSLIASLEEGATEGALPAEFVAEMKEFIDDPDSFSLTLAPDQPVPFISFTQLNTPGDFIKLLNARLES